MSGLLDKAKDVSKSDGETASPSSSAEKGSGLLDKVKAPSKSSGGSTSTGQAGIGLGLVTMCVVVYMVWDLNNWEGIIPFALLLLAWGCTAWGFKEIKGDWNKNRTIAIGLSFLVVAAIPYFAAFSWQGGNVRASEFSIDEANDNLLFTLYNTVGEDASASIEVGGEEVWSATGIEYSTKGYSEVSAPLSEVYQGSTLDQNGNAALTYTIKVSSGDAEWEDEIDADILHRTITAAGADMIPVTEQVQQGTPGSGNEHTETNHLGLQIRLGLGQELLNLERGENGEGLWDVRIKQISGDYSLTLSINKDGSEVWSVSSIFTIDGESMTSNGGDSGTLIGGWMDLELSNSMDVQTNGENEVYYIPRDDFYDDGDGCYKIMISVTHSISTGEVHESFESINGFHYYWEENENRDSGVEYKPAVAC